MKTTLGLDQDLINAVTQIVESSCSSKKMEKEELHPNQVKLDKNKNGKLDADDFKKLRKEEETDENYVSHAQRKAVWASKNEKGVKEEVEELDELSKDTLKSYVAKAEPEADKLGDKYSTQRMKRDKTHGHFSNDTPELEKLGRKAANREDGVWRANKKLNKEQMEEIEALAAKHGLGE